MLTRRLVALGFSLIGVALGGEARAALVTWEFEAISRSFVEPSYSHAGLVLSPGMPLRGTLTFESDTPESPVGTVTSTYPGAITSVSLEVFGPGYDTFPYGWLPVSFALSSSQIQVVEFPTSTPDRTLFISNGQLSYGLGFSMPYQVAQLTLRGQGFTSNGAIPLIPPSLASLDPFAPRLPTTPPSLSVFPTGTGLYLTGLNPPVFMSGFYAVDLELTSLRAVPEPAGSSIAALFALTSLALARAGICKLH